MKTSVTLLAGLIIGLIAGIFLTPVYSGNNSSQEKAINTQSTDARKSQQDFGVLSKKAKGIELVDAWRMFDDYHGVTHSRSRACLTTTVEEGGVPKEKNIESIYLPYEGFLKVIKGRVESKNETFLGLAGIPAYKSHPDTLSHTMIWVPVVAGDNGKKEYFIPQDDASNFIFEYVGICPDFCPENRCDIWKRDWDVNALCTVNF